MSKRTRKRKLEGEEQSMVDWEEENIFPDKIKKEMASMWEIPQIFHFLHLAKEALNIPHLSMYEMERMLLMPRASKQLANIMTSLLSSPVTKAKLRKIPPMPYEFWTNILAHKMKGWFKIYEGKHRDAVKVLETIGVEPEFWHIFPDAPLLNGKDFEELSFKQRVWLLKTVCDTVMHTRKTVQDEMTKQPWEDQFETVLGTDRYGARYIYFPQFINSDLRIYRHYLDNKILSTVKPIKPKATTEVEYKEKGKDSAVKKKVKNRRRRRWCNGKIWKPKKHVNDVEGKRSNDCKCSSDSATGSFTNEDTNLSSTSTYSNNNNINLDDISRKRSRSLSKTSEISTTSDDRSCNVKSSGYDTTSSIDNNSDRKSSQKMFKGFSNSDNSKCNIKIISGILNDLKTELGDGKTTDDTDISLLDTTQENLKPSSTKYLTNVAADRDESTDRSVDNLSGSRSKTDDEKLNEIIGAESSKLKGKVRSNFPAGKETDHVSSTSKSDDEKLSETRSTDDYHKRDDNASRKMEKSMQTRQSRYEEKSNKCVSNEKETARTDKARSSDITDNNGTESNDEKDLSLSELRSMLQREAMQNDFSFDEHTETGYNLRKMKDDKPYSWKQNVDDFNEMLLELGISKFQLVVDSVESLRDLISSFKPISDHPNDNSNNEGEPVLPSEIKLVKKLKELLQSLVKVETSLRESMKKARGKLQKEWTNFKEGSVEDQDSSGEGGLGSNWWILGSQGCPLPTPGDATLQTLPQPALSPAGSQNHTDKNESRQEEKDRRTEQSKRDGESTEHQGESAENKTGKNGEKRAGAEKEKKKNTTEEEQQSRRVLRARGISSYTEQLYSDDEIETNELEEWTDIEAVYAAPSAQISTPAPNTPAKVRHSDDWSAEEDSDKDWILPGARKRKNKRPSASRRLKSFQHKMQCIKNDTLQDAVDAGTVNPANTKNEKEKEKSRIREAKVSRPKRLITPQANNADAVVSSTNNVDAGPDTMEGDANTVNSKATTGNNPKNTGIPFTEIRCKVENVESVQNFDNVSSMENVQNVQSFQSVENVNSVHSELDIKEEGPIYDTASNHFDNNYATNLQPNYLMVKTDHNPMNYYVMQPNTGTIVPQNTIMQPGPVVSGIMPPIQQGYYVQSGQNYIIHNTQPSFVSAPTFQPSGPQMLAPQQFISPPGYVPYMVSTTHSQAGFVTAQMPRGQVPSQEVRQEYPTAYNQTPPRPPPNRFPIPRQNFPHPNGAVIRSSLPIRGNFPRTNNARSAKAAPQQRVAPPKPLKPRNPTPQPENTIQKTTSLIVLSDSDDEIEMIITEKTGPNVDAEKVKMVSRRNVEQPQPKATVTSDITVASSKGVIPPQIIQRMSQGGISITPVKPPVSAQNSNTQLVVVVNDTGSHYALSLPNGSKLILTPEQVAQIRASNGGKLIL